MFARNVVILLQTPSVMTLRTESLGGNWRSRQRFVEDGSDRFSLSAQVQLVSQ
jgi:hypothetical protein